jgi:methionyl-tRNA formyltransferase
MKCLFFSRNNEWSNSLYKNLKDNIREVEWVRCCKKEDYKHFDNLKPDWVFFFHWNHIVPKEVFSKTKCVVLHTSNLPRHRGGSPIQNQIIERVKTTNVNAIKMVEEVDAGPIYGSAKISIQGSLRDIWMSIANESEKLIADCIAYHSFKDTPVAQTGTTYPCLRRKTSEIPVNDVKTLEDLYDYIRMLDAEGYNRSFVSLGKFKLEFSRASIVNGDYLISDVRITEL